MFCILCYPLTSFQNRFLFLSPSHTWEFSDNLLLCCCFLPFFIICLVISLLFLKKSQRLRALQRLGFLHRLYGFLPVPLSQTPGLPHRKKSILLGIGNMINYNDCIFVCVCFFFPEFALQLLVALGIIYLCEENLATWYGVLSDSLPMYLLTPLFTLLFHAPVTS